jgi:hypothetical protein
MTSEVERTINVIPSTDISCWTVWSKHFLARAHVKGYKKILLKTEQVPKFDEQLDVTTDAGKKKANIRNLNEVAYDDLLLSFSDIVNFSLIHQAVTEELPDGDAGSAWTNLCNKHEMKTSSNKVKLKLENNQSQLTDAKTDPELWIANLESTRIRLGKINVDISDDDMIIHIINNLPKEYEAVSDEIESDFDNVYATVDMEYIKNRLRSKFNKMNKRSVSSNKAK